MQDCWQPHKLRDDLELGAGRVRHDLLVLEDTVTNMPSRSQTVNFSPTTEDQRDCKTQHPGYLEELTWLSLHFS